MTVSKLSCNYSGSLAYSARNHSMPGMISLKAVNDETWNLSYDFPEKISDKIVANSGGRQQFILDSNIDAYEELELLNTNDLLDENVPSELLLFLSEPTVMDLFGVKVTGHNLDGLHPGTDPMRNKNVEPGTARINEKIQQSAKRALEILVAKTVEGEIEAQGLSEIRRLPKKKLFKELKRLVGHKEIASEMDFMMVTRSIYSNDDMLKA